jgi:fibronectin-binding autotransporter adhesin
MTNITLNGATLLATASLTTAANRGVSLGSSGGTLKAQSASTTLTVAGDISGSGALTKSGPGTLVLTGSATHSGGTTVSLGTFQIGAGGGIGSVAGNIADNAAVVFDRSDNISFAGVISGGGTLAQSGGGKLTFTANQTYSGATSVNSGTLELPAANSMASTSYTVAGGATFNAFGSLASTSTVVANGPINFGAPASIALSTQQLASLTIASGVTASITSANTASVPKTLQVASPLSINGTGKFDITNNIVIAAGTAGDARGLILSHAVTSSTPGNGLTLGYKAVSIPASSFEIRTTLLGDSDLDGKVNVADLANLAGNFGVTTGMNWIQGDFDYNQNVNVADLADLAGNFGKDLASSGFGSTAAAAAMPAAAAAVPAAAAAVPEPASIATILIGAIGLLPRRVRRLR